MAIIPQHESKELPSASPGGAMIPEGMAHSGPEAALERAGDVVARIGEEWNKELTDTRRADEFSKAKSQAHKEYGELSARYQDPRSDMWKDPTSAKASLDRDMQAIDQRALASVKDPRVKAQLQNQLRDIGTNVSLSVGSYGQKAEIGHLKDNAFADIDTYIHAGVNARDDAFFQKSLDSAQERIGWLHAQRLISDKETVDMLSELPDKMLTAKAGIELQQDGQAFQNRFNDPSTIYGQMSPEAKSHVAPHAEVKIRQDEEHARVTAERIKAETEKKNVESAITNVTQLNGLDKIDGHWMDAIKDLSDLKGSQSALLTTPELRLKAVGHVLQAQAGLEHSKKIATDADVTSAWSDFVDGKPELSTAEQVDAFKGKNSGERLDPGTRDKMKAAINKSDYAKNYDDEQVKLETFRGIMNGDIQKDDDIYGKAGGGLGFKTVPGFVKLLHFVHDNQVKAAMGKLEKAVAVETTDAGITSTVAQDFVEELQAKAEDGKWAGARISFEAKALLPKYVKQAADMEKERISGAKKARELEKKTGKKVEPPKTGPATSPPPSEPGGLGPKVERPMAGAVAAVADKPSAGSTTPPKLLGPFGSEGAYYKVMPDGSSQLVTPEEAAQIRADADTKPAAKVGPTVPKQDDIPADFPIPGEGE